LGRLLLVALPVAQLSLAGGKARGLMLRAAGAQSANGKGRKRHKRACFWPVNNMCSAAFWLIVCPSGLVAKLEP